MKLSSENQENAEGIEPGAAEGEQISAHNPFPIVGIGASAGGLEAFTKLFSSLPEKTGMAYLLVQHLDPDHQSHLADLVAKATAMPVLEVTDGTKVKPDHVYVIPPNVNMSIMQGKLRLTPRNDSHIPHFPVDFLFNSLAKEQQSWAVGVILSGTGSDGSAGLANIKNNGGLTFVQDEKSAKFSGMPLHAASSSVDFVLPPEKIAHELARIGHDPYLTLPTKNETVERQTESSRDFRRILSILRSHMNVDLSQYRDATIKRRIQRRMVVHARDSLTEYAKLLEKDPLEVKSLFEDVLIGVTSFFRDPEMFEALRTDIFPAMLKASPQVIRIWVTACSTGQEAYSMAITLLELLENNQTPPAIQIFATDINELIAIEKARRGFFPDCIETEVSPERLRRFFTKEEGGYRISKNIRDLCIFAKQNIAFDPPFSRMDLISCRNLLIYFTPELQRRVISTFHYALNQTGFLVLGSSETVGANGDMFEVRDRKHKIFSKKGMAVRPFSHFTAEDLKPGVLATTRSKAPYSPGPADFQKEADRVLLGRYAPAAVLVNSNLEVLQFRGRTSLYLEPPSGPASFNLLKMARDNLPLELGKVIQEARRGNSSVRSSAQLRDSETIRKINLEVLPLKLAGSIENCFLVLFEETGREITELEMARQKSRDFSDAQRPVAEKDREVHDLRRDLAAAREYLQAVVEQHDASNEELKCANEEVLSSNEELQSTNEQLGTAKEELQSTNEELVTLNEELQTRNVELTQINEEYKKAHQKFMEEKNARETAEMASRAKDDFLAMLSHELRTPLNPILLIASDSANDASLTPETRERFETIRKNVELESRLIDDLLDHTHIIKGTLSLTLKIIDAHQVLRDAIAAIQTELEVKEIEITLNFHAQQTKIHADAVRMHQVFSNILKNAVKFTPAKGKISVTTSNVSDSKLRVEITDSGYGIMPDELARIFTPFTQGDHAGNKSHTFGGLGLGLAITRKLLESHAGSIKAVSAGRDSGSTFIVELPISQSTAGFSVPASELFLAQNATNVWGRILLVEDHKPTCEALAQLLTRRQYRVSSANSVTEARALAEKDQFDLVISDIGLPDGNGNDLMAELRDRFGLKGIALTGYGMEQDIARSHTAGFVAHLIKPVSVQALEKALAAFGPRLK